ncbi:MAG: MFS transporter [Campylobacterales bacterium]|nr:MFS transporter [Campylobacterales bacterium]
MFATPGALFYLFALFLNAFSDLGHKIIIQNTVFKIYDNETQVMLTAIINALMLIPFIALFTPSGYLADKYPKHLILRYGALFALAVTLLITLCYYMGWFWAAFWLTFVMGAQSAIYGPAKYGYIKELFGNERISAGNALVQSGTTVAILSGIIAYTVLFELRLSGDETNEAEILRHIAPLGWLLVAGSVLEYLFAYRLPDKQGLHVKKRFDTRRYLRGYYLRKNLKATLRKREIAVAIVALSLFWSISQVILAAFGAYAKAHLGMQNAIMVQGLMALAAIGIILGSVVAAHISRRYIHKGLIPLGSLGLTLCVWLLPMLDSAWAIAVTFSGFGLFAGFFIVPLNAYIQQHAPRAHLGTILAGNNFIQHISMALFLGLITLFSYYGLDPVALFYLMGALGLVMSLYLLRRHLDWFVWVLIELLLSVRYKIIYENAHLVPQEGGVLLLGNHISWIDWVLAQFPIERRIRFVMDRGIYRWPVLHYLWRLGRAIPISEKGSKDAFAEARAALRTGELLGYYPEGMISYSGEMSPFRRGFELIAKGIPATISPYYIGGIYGSFPFSRAQKRLVQERSLWRRVIRVRFGVPLGIDSDAAAVQAAVTALKEDNGPQ